MTTLVPGLLAIALYSGGFIYHVLQVRRNPNFNATRLQFITAFAIAGHAIAVLNFLLHPDGLDLGLLKVFSLIALAINTMVFVSGLTKIQHSLYLLLFPISAITLLLTTLYPSSKPIMTLSHGMQAHVIVSILAYSLLAIAALQALLSGFQSWLLKHKRQNALMKTLPPLQAMERLLFEIIWVGEIFLTLSLISGFIFYDDFFEQKLLHKVVLSLVAWLFYAILLCGRYYWGWRGHTATRLTWAGFLCVLMGFIGSKFVLEFLLAQPPIATL
ncbi:MAG: cytochrome c biogenesis protein CcsA [Porticoccaceae bacterium]|nr:cytochrome c biogenesis protein CcsA [Porticoccaceae bacterium]